MLGHGVPLGTIRGGVADRVATDARDCQQGHGANGDQSGLGPGAKAAPWAWGLCLSARGPGFWLRVLGGSLLAHLAILPGTGTAMRGR